MNSRLTETQNLIADIDRLLTNKRLSRFLSNQSSEPRQVLERVRDFLLTLAESDQLEREQRIQQSPLLAKFALGGKDYSPGQVNERPHEEGVDVVTQQDHNQFSALLAPLQAELQALLQERANLVEEIRQLEQRRLHNYSLTQQLANQEKMISEFLQVLSNRILPNSVPLRADNAANHQVQQLFGVDAAGSATVNTTGYTQPVSSSQPPLLNSPDQAERLTQFARELDQKLLALDGTVNVVFDALQRNIHTYHESLSQSLARMHSQGAQGEQLLIGLINNLTQYVQQPASSSESYNSDVKEKTPKPTVSQQLLSESPDIAQVVLPLSLTNNNLQVSSEEHEDTTTTPNSDSVPFQLSQDTQEPSVTSTTNAQLHPDNSSLIHDEVDELYASLFGNEVTDAVTDEATDAVTDVTDERGFDTPMTPVQTQLQPEVAPPQDAVDLKKPTSFIDELFMDATASPSPKTTPPVPSNPVQPEVGSKTLTSEVKKPTNFIDELFMDATASPYRKTTPPIQGNLVQSELTLKTGISEGKNLTNFPDELFIDFTPSSSTTTPLTLDSESDTNKLTSENFADEAVFEGLNIATDELDVDITVPSIESLTETSPAPHTTPEQLVEPVTEIPDPWTNSSNSSLLKPSHAHTEDSQVPLENVVTDLVVSGEATSLVEEPAPADTITALTDLLGEMSESEQLLEEPSVSPTSTAVVNSEAEPAVIVIDNREVDLPSDFYISASPEENLLSQEENDTPEVADISLEEAQLQQLEQDLASFDGEINSLLQPLTDLEDTEKVQNRFFPQEVPQQVDTELDSSSPVAQTAETEKKKEVIEEQITGSSVSISHPINSTKVSHDAVNSVWYLGIDLGTTGISAALLNRSTIEVYPLYWTAENQAEATSIKRSFRLPAEVYLPTASVTSGETESKETQEQPVLAAVAAQQESSNETTTPTHNLFSAQLKPYLQIALPYKNERQKWEPVLQLNEFSTVPLVWVVRSLSKLLLTLMSDRSSTTLGLTAAAVGIEPDIFYNIISNLSAVVCTCPCSWTEQYRFNVREALLNSKLVQHPQQVFFVEEAIASLLSELDGSEGEIVQIRSRQGFRLAKTSDRPLVGSTLIINTGASTTEMGLVDLPENLEELTHNDFMLHGFAYAGKGVEQDIICQLLLPTKWRQPRTSTQSDSKTSTSNPWHWQPGIPGLDQMRLSALGLEEFSLPRPGEPDTVERIRLQQRLESSLLGKAVIDAATALKLILQHQESFTLELADQRWVLQRRDLESYVFVPFVRRLNRELNRLLVAKGIPTEAINQTILTGGLASLGAVSRWLRQKLPNAKIIQDVYLGENGSPSCSRVAYGLAMLPLHPQVLEVPKQQYTDYFLFTELLRILPTRAISFGEVIQLFENRGINTRSCQQRLLAFLEGELPPGLVPSSQDSSWLIQSSLENPDYKAVTAAPLFEKQGSLTYRPNSQQLRSIAHYLDAIKASSEQSLDEPYTVNFAVGVVQ